MPTLSAVFKLNNQFSSAVDKIYNSTVKAKNAILGASKSADDFGKKLSGMKKSSDSANSSLKGLIASAVSVAGVMKGLNITDAYTNTNARLAMINDGLQSQAQLNDKVFQAAQRSRGSYMEMASAVAKMNLLAGDTFKTNDEAIAFTELLTKSLKVSGASQGEQSSAFLQLTQALAAGKLQGDEFRSIMENAPMVAQAIADFTGKSKGELKEMSAEGTITADIIKNAMFMAADDIESKFATMPKTFGDTWNMIKNEAMMAFSGVMTSLNNMLNSANGQALVNGLLQGINLLAAGATWLFDTIAAGGPVVQTVLATAAILAGLWAANMLISAAASLAAYWPLLLIAAGLFMVMMLLNQTGITFAQVFGFIGMLLFSFFAVAYNVVALVWNLFVSLAEFLGNLFVDPIGSIVNLFVGMANSVLGILQDLARAIDSVFGTNLAGAVGGLMTGLKSVGDAVKSDKYKSFDEFRMDFADSTSAAELGKKLGTSFGSGIDNFGFGDLGINPNAGGGIDYSQYMTAMPSTGGLGGIGGGSGGGKGLGSAGNPATVKGSGAGGSLNVSLADEDIDYLRQLAERDYVARIAQNTLAPNIRVEFSGPINQTADVNAVASRIGQILRDEIETAPEGLY